MGVLDVIAAQKSRFAVRDLLNQKEDVNKAWDAIFDLMGDTRTRATMMAIAGSTNFTATVLTGSNNVPQGYQALTTPNVFGAKVEVRSGAAHLALTARALSGGRVGETIPVRNPESNRTFQARVTGKGTVLVEAGGGPRGI